MNPPLNPDFSTPINLPDFSGLDLNFEIIDAHHHLFDLDEVYYPWLTDEPEKHFLLGNYDALKRNYSCEDYRKDTEKLKIVKTVDVGLSFRQGHPQQARHLPNCGNPRLGSSTSGKHS